MPNALTIAGSDSGGGAGIQADLKTFAALGVFGTSAITSVTAQNTVGVQGVYDLPAKFVGRQIDSVLEDIVIDAAKTGMLSNAAIIEVVAEKVAAHRITRLVVDPVMVAKGGAPLLQRGAVKTLIERLLPLALVVTPNVPEAEVLWGQRIVGFAEMREAAQRIHGLGPRYVVLKGGHLGIRAIDLVYDGSTFTMLDAERIDTPHTHGTGCVFSAAMTAELAKGSPVPEAIATAKRFITSAIRHGFQLGKGIGPTDPMTAAQDLAPS
ncbi:phosphomethylpyrimidine kinase [Candidatus Methylomirabilis lanthanidiphila]|uniref:hydroxymethylpyrimidine kinase n=1 Tax=Candidatus Methylomirabilis lanthanidiphila TaxID=2211376 RepID=A0A564ZF78_9BACT|nr:bifunctional hydroxymethylpyrimidine kinase/phosphomethylpyrimidine kinase [Candidatus Methylomirabilis lanthanidiphila]VUZ83803.1 phosphomethylpyrimidine kinase [Candidatus Methylomirabilis lanthanidiphila]